MVKYYPNGGDYNNWTTTAFQSPTVYACVTVVFKSPTIVHIKGTKAVTWTNAYLRKIEGVKL